MPKLYYTPTSCGAASFIAAFVAHINLQVEQVDLKAHLTKSGEDFYQINPKGNVPTLVLDDGTILNEGAAILQYIADLKAGSIAPLNGTKDRSLVQNVLNYISSEIQQAVVLLLNPNCPPEAKSLLCNRLDEKLQYVEKHLLKDHDLYLVNNTFSIADCYLYISLTWLNWLSKTLDEYPRLKAYFERIKELPKVKEAHERMLTNPTNIF